MATELFACILVETDVVPEVVTLENAVMLHHPAVGFRNKWFENARCNIRVIEGCKVVANVVNECAHDVLGIAPVFFGSRGGL